MNTVPAILPVTAQVPDPVPGDPVDKRPDTLVPAQDDELPQGVLDLLAALLVRQRSATVPPAGSQGVDLRAGVEPPREPIEARHPRSYRATHPDAVSTVRRLDLLTKTATQAPIYPENSPQVATEAPAAAPEWLPVSRAANVTLPTLPAADTPLPEAVMTLPGMRHAAVVSPVLIPVPATPVPTPAFDILIEPLPDVSRGLFQVPFNKGAVSGQVTITRVADEPVQNLQLSPSNSQVFEQLKAPFELSRDPAWRLTDTGDEQQHQGSQQQQRDEEQAEQQDLPACER